MKHLVAACGFLLAAAVFATNTTSPLYKNPDAPVDDRVADLLQRMTIEEKTAQLIQGDIRDYLDIENGTYNETGMAWIAETRANSIWTGLFMNRSMVARGARLGQDYLVNKTRLGKARCISPRSRVLTDGHL
jgi:beta-glucosidase